MEKIQKKITTDHLNVRKHCLFREKELNLIKEATHIAGVSFSHFVRRSAIRNAEAVTGRRVAPL